MIGLRCRGFFSLVYWLILERSKQKKEVYADKCWFKWLAQWYKLWSYGWTTCWLSRALLANIKRYSVMYTTCMYKVRFGLAYTFICMCVFSYSCYVHREKTGRNDSSLCTRRTKHKGDRILSSVHLLVECWINGSIQWLVEVKGYARSLDCRAG